MPIVVNQILKAKSHQENFPQIFGFLQKKCWEGKRVANKKLSAHVCFTEEGYLFNQKTW